MRSSLSQALYEMSTSKAKLQKQVVPELDVCDHRVADIGTEEAGTMFPPVDFPKHNHKPKPNPDAIADKDPVLASASHQQHT